MNASLYTHWICLICIGILTISRGGTPSVSPGKVVTITFEEANAGHYEEAESHLTSKAKAQMNGMLARLAGGHIKLWDGWTKGRTLTRIEILKEEIHGTEATVKYRFHYKDGSSRDDEDDFALEDGEWKFLP